MWPTLIFKLERFGITAPTPIIVTHTDNTIYLVQQTNFDTTIVLTHTILHT